MLYDDAHMTKYIEYKNRGPIIKASVFYHIIGSIINVGATHIRVVANIFCCNKIDIYKLIPYH